MIAPVSPRTHNCYKRFKGEDRGAMGGSSAVQAPLQMGGGSRVS